MKKHIKKIIAAGMWVMAAPRIFASQVNIPQLEEVATTIQSFFTSTPVQIFFAIALAAMGIGFIANRDNEQAKKKFLMWGIGIGVVLGAQYITKMFFTEGALIL